MMRQFQIWLYPLLLLGLITIFARIKIGLYWSWASILQAVALTACGVLGFRPGPDWLFALIGWLIFGVFFALPRILMNQVNSNVTLLNPERVELCGRLLKVLLWGRPGQFWLDLTTASLVMRGKRLRVRLSWTN